MPIDRLLDIQTDDPCPIRYMIEAGADGQEQRLVGETTRFLAAVGSEGGAFIVGCGTVADLLDLLRRTVKELAGPREIEERTLLGVVALGIRDGRREMRR